MHQESTINYSAIPGLTFDERTFLDDIFARFPRTKKGYVNFINTHPHNRIPKAAQILQTQPRTGWVLRFPNLPPVFRPVPINGKQTLLYEFSEAGRESVLEHCAEAAELYGAVYSHFKDHPISPSIEIIWGMECLKFHDFHEAIDGDFTPRCPITREEKIRINIHASFM